MAGGWGGRPFRWRFVGPACAGAALLLAGPLQAQWPYGVTVEQTVHNLSRTARVSPMAGMIANYGSACVYCHTPHGGDATRPIWNRRLPSGPYRMYESETIDMIADPQPTGSSRLCLSCHDGTIGLDDVANRPNTFVGPGPFGETIERCTSCHNGGNPAGGFDWENVWFRPDDLRNQHPISIEYDPGRDPGFNGAATVEAAGLKLEGGKVQCVTCHEPHAQQNRPFLRIPNTSGSLCRVCHAGDPGESTAHFW